jgi:uncharacterized protein YpmS
MLLSPASAPVTPNVKEPTDNFVPFHVQTNKQDINKLVNYYLSKEVKSSPVNYRVNLGNEVELYGKIPFFTEQLDMKLTFEPETLKNGNLILRQKSISIGRLQLPVTYILKIVADSYKLPAGVEIEPNQKLVYIDMSKVKLKNNMKVKVDQFDLKKNNIAFTIFVPVK